MVLVVSTSRGEARGEGTRSHDERERTPTDSIGSSLPFCPSAFFTLLTMALVVASIAATGCAAIGGADDFGCFVSHHDNARLKAIP